MDYTKLKTYERAVKVHEELEQEIKFWGEIRKTAKKLDEKVYLSNCIRKLEHEAHIVRLYIVTLPTESELEELNALLL